ncbi:right-handed parallel beta-helix repeat-containing protein [Conexibacter sp. JD483]|uniref:right-handed parallel beta-helix repeat-containing protein n=1 Tax=unclassified Conexibacter TaxID=2627773 RepID=UPI00271F460B|nr:MULTISPECIES: right-handed parallel beta-helix repeat-containing protein [unclassified Conexibacter]MDO8185530.1 right-handed parallel beta-helix repeat-containing protein [Conexibacter sp. CPCC 205706]MDO8197283.1 right-handed parallel beta-helix repeat-containing protein [Conexibacter sp. CPCC 205762]MDR9370779.1 right-handed parallel beta-helix repeat-containing protein [Conexibacter sp. JD483]
MRTTAQPTRALLAGGLLALLLGAGVVPGAAPAAPATSAAGQRFTVAPSGDDANPGTAARPWRTISRAARAATPGSVVDVRAGTYRELVDVRVSGRPGAPIVFRAHPGEHVTISGAGASAAVSSGTRPLIRVDGRAHLRFEGFELTDHVDLSDRSVPVGVYVTGASHHVVLSGLDVHGIRTRGGNAHGIAVYGTDGRRPIHDVTISRNRVHDNKLGSSEAVVVNGNVRGWRIVRNHVFRNDNIGIDAIGYEGTAPRNDWARDGLIADNRVERIDSLGNPAYAEPNGGNCRCADGIYVDGGRDIEILRNVVETSNIGIELASEHANGRTANVLVRGNRVSRSTSIGLAMGGYDRRRGKTVGARVIGNTFVDNDTLHSGNGELLLQFQVHDSQILRNTFVANSQAILLANPYRENSGNVVDGNTWWVRGAPPAAARFQWRTIRYRGFAAYQRGTGNDRHGRFGPPRGSRASGVQELVGARGRSGSLGGQAR